MSARFCIAFCVLHILQVVAIAILYTDYKFVDPALYEAVKDTKSLDVVNVAAQLGRFDLASLFLGGTSLVIAIAAVFGFLEVRSKSVRVATEVASLQAEKTAQEVAELQIRPEAERIIEAFFERKGIDISQLPTKSDKIAGEGADIAKSMESKDDE